MRVQSFHDKATATFTHIVIDPATKQAAVIDPVLGYDAQAGIVSSTPVQAIIAFLQAEGLRLEWILETHIHADHLTGAGYLKQKMGGKIAIGKKILEVLKHWVPLLNTGKDTPLDGSQFDHLFEDGETFKIGGLEAWVMYTPGHTPDGITYVIGDAAFVGDTIFMPHGGTARADFPGGNAHALYKSIQKILALPEKTRVFACHDYPPQGKEATCESLVAAQKADNIMIGKGRDEASYVEARENRDETLNVPKLLYPSLQVNMRAGSLGTPEANGIQYIKIPLNLGTG
jgi:glyoxylase-like metal-dependent hydrolase (beta-lactamase superfamily II)